MVDELQPAAQRRRVGVSVALVMLLVSGLVACCKSKATSGPAAAGKPTGPGCVLKLVADNSYTCALLHDGRVQCWGRSAPTLKDRFQTQPATLTSFSKPAKDLFVDYVSVCITADDDALWCAGTNYWERDSKYSPIAKRLQYNAVTSLTWDGHCVLWREGLSCWPPGGTASLVSDLPARPKQVSGGRAFACVLLENGKVYCRGSNLSGQLGILQGNTDEERDAFRIAGLPGFTEVTGLGGGAQMLRSSRVHSCALKDDGSVWCWGENRRGQIGKGDVAVCKAAGLLDKCSPEDGLVPTRVDGLPKNLRSIAVGYNTSCAITLDGAAWCWGALPKSTPTPQRLNLPEPLEALAVSDTRGLCGLFKSGVVRCHDLRQPLTDWSETTEMELDCH